MDVYSRYEHFYWFFVMILKRKGDTPRMKKITMFNVEKFLNLMDGKEDTFNDINWIEPIYIAMIRAYLDDNRLEISTDNSYIKQMIENDFQKDKTYTPIENVKTRMGLEKISTHLSSIMLQNFQNLSPVDLKDLREKSWGKHEGMGFEEIIAQNEIVYETFPQWIEALDGEPYEKYIARVKKFFLEFLPQQNGENILVVTHAGVIRVLMAIVQELSLEEAFSIDVPYSSFVVYDTNLKSFSTIKCKLS